MGRATTATSPEQDLGSARAYVPRDRTAALGLPSAGSVHWEGTATSLAMASSATRLRSALDLAISLIIWPLLAARAALRRFFLPYFRALKLQLSRTMVVADVAFCTSTEFRVAADQLRRLRLLPRQLLHLHQNSHHRQHHLQTLRTSRP